MKIVMMEPLGVDKRVIEGLAKPFVDDGHDFVPCFEKIDGREKLIETASDADVLIIANSPLEGDVVKACPKLKMISVAFTGIDHVDAAACKEKGVLVSNAAGYSTDSVVELTFGLILNVLRNINKCDEATRAGKTKEGLVGHELSKKTVGIIGTGAIGIKVAKVAKAFDCKVLGYSRSERQEALEAGVEYTSIDELLRKSDIVTIHTPLTEETRLLLDKERISLMKPSAVLINAARGGIVDSKALADALNNGKLSGAGIDVFEMEPPIPSDHTLLNSRNTILTPHVAFATDESMVRRAEFTFENIDAWIKGTPIRVMLKP